ncbi:uncharacterized protein PB18E9.04c-like [Schistocerca americana]|uniref:uncharacterized protein PB18E9.04c-like n=1 Tax=Schistocerca americana TaxID=7009 RepID=UPI001F4F8D83|nr:uncharacterized protein PB18E9.04c-like [Schistocerca americana]
MKILTILLAVCAAVTARPDILDVKTTSKPCVTKAKTSRVGILEDKVAASRPNEPGVPVDPEVPPQGKPKVPDMADLKTMILLAVLVVAAARPGVYDGVPSPTPCVTKEKTSGVADPGEKPAAGRQNEPTTPSSPELPPAGKPTVSVQVPPFPANPETSTALPVSLAPATPKNMDTSSTVQVLDKPTVVSPGSLPLVNFLSNNLPIFPSLYYPSSIFKSSHFPFYPVPSSLPIGEDVCFTFGTTVLCFPFSAGFPSPYFPLSSVGTRPQQGFPTTDPVTSMSTAGASFGNVMNTAQGSLVTGRHPVYAFAPEYSSVNDLSKTILLAVFAVAVARPQILDDVPSTTPHVPNVKTSGSADLEDRSLINVPSSQLPFLLPVEHLPDPYYPLNTAKTTQLPIYTARSNFLFSSGDTTFPFSTSALCFLSDVSVPYTYPPLSSFVTSPQYGFPIRNPVTGLYAIDFSSDNGGSFGNVMNTAQEAAMVNRPSIYVFAPEYLSFNDVREAILLAAFAVAAARPNILDDLSSATPHETNVKTCGGADLQDRSLIGVPSSNLPVHPNPCYPFNTVKTTQLPIYTAPSSLPIRSGDTTFPFGTSALCFLSDVGVPYTYPFLSSVVTSPQYGFPMRNPVTGLQTVFVSPDNSGSFSNVMNTAQEAVMVNRPSIYVFAPEYLSLNDLGERILLALFAVAAARPNILDDVPSATPQKYYEEKDYNTTHTNTTKKKEYLNKNIWKSTTSTTTKLPVNLITNYSSTNNIPEVILSAVLALAVAIPVDAEVECETSAETSHAVSLEDKAADSGESKPAVITFGKPGMTAAAVTETPGVIEGGPTAVPATWSPEAITFGGVPVRLPAQGPAAALSLYPDTFSFAGVPVKIASSSTLKDVTNFGQIPLPVMSAGRN